MRRIDRSASLSTHILRGIDTTDEDGITEEFGWREAQLKRVPQMIVRILMEVQISNLGKKRFDVCALL